MVKCELYRDSFQNWKTYQIPRAQLILTDIPYGDNSNGESKLAKKSFFYSDGYFRISEFFLLEMKA